jgi:KUP system potassium uptake protein
MEYDSSKSKRGIRKFLPLLAALGVVFGDIGTSPLYALRICFSATNGIPISEENVIGILSLIFWALTLIISIKYIFIIMRANNKGEGGVLALLTLFHGKGRGMALFTLLGLVGAALLFGDGLITPSISVLSAIEGLNVATGFFQPFIVPIAAVILAFLFWIQHKGTAHVGKLFGPIMLVWFISIFILGIRGILENPHVFKALYPGFAVDFFLKNRFQAFVTLSGVFLVLTGGEALYADMGHFGREPLKQDWFLVVFPALLINYFGQGAYLLNHPGELENLFFRIVPSWGLIPMVLLATAATVIASQAIISGIFSMTRQAMQLNICPRMEIRHTSNEAIGQVYVPVMNSLLFFGTIILVLTFKESGNLANAYGVAVSTTMVITTLMVLPIMVQNWKWPPLLAYPLIILFSMINVAFMAANLLKISHGGWISLLVGGSIFLILQVWKNGRSILKSKISNETIDEKLFLEDIKITRPHRVQGTAVFFTGDAKSVPKSLLHNFKHNQILHTKVVFLTVKTREVPFVEATERVEIRSLGEGFFRIILQYGYSEDPDIPLALASIKHPDLAFIISQTTFFLGKISLLPEKESSFPAWQQVLFIFLTRNAGEMWKYYRLPPNRVIEVGAQITL